MKGKAAGVIERSEVQLARRISLRERLQFAQVALDAATDDAAHATMAGQRDAIGARTKVLELRLELIDVDLEAKLDPEDKLMTIKERMSLAADLGKERHNHRQASKQLSDDLLPDLAARLDQFDDRSAAFGRLH